MEQFGRVLITSLGPCSPTTASKSVSPSEVGRESYTPTPLNRWGWPYCAITLPMTLMSNVLCKGWPDYLMKDTWIVNLGTIRHPSFSTSQGYLILPIKSNSLAYNTPNPSLRHSQAHSLLTTSACMHGWTSYVQTQHKQATTQVYKRLKSAHDTTQDVKGNVYV